MSSTSWSVIGAWAPIFSGSTVIVNAAKSATASKPNTVIFSFPMIKFLIMSVIN